MWSVGRLCDCLSSPKFRIRTLEVYTHIDEMWHVDVFETFRFWKYFFVWFPWRNYVVSSKVTLKHVFVSIPTQDGRRGNQCFHQMPEKRYENVNFTRLKSPILHVLKNWKYWSFESPISCIRSTFVIIWYMQTMHFTAWLS